MTDQIAPLTPSESDLRDFPFMPFQIQRLKSSRAWLLCKRNPALAFYLINLWTAAWHSKPAGSMENDDMVLADAAMCSDEVFAELRQEIMRGWIECADGRLYHPVIAEQVHTAWDRKCARRSQTEAARLAREAKRREAATTSVTEDATTTVTGSKGQGQGQGYIERPSQGSGDRSPADQGDAEPQSGPARPPKVAKPRQHDYPADAFGTWYASFPNKKNRADAEKAFAAIVKADDIPFATLMDGIAHFGRVKPDYAAWPHPASWLRGQRWLDEPEGSVAKPPGGAEPVFELPGGGMWSIQTTLSRMAKARDDPTSWPIEAAGPPPGAPGCKIPDAILRLAA